MYQLHIIRCGTTFNPVKVIWRLYVVRPADNRDSRRGLQVILFVFIIRPTLIWYERWVIPPKKPSKLNGDNQVLYSDHPTAWAYCSLRVVCKFPTGLHCRMLPVVTYCKRRAKVVLFACGFTCNVWWGSWVPQSCLDFRLWQMHEYVHNAQSVRPIWTNESSQLDVPLRIFR